MWCINDFYFSTVELLPVVLLEQLNYSLLLLEQSKVDLLLDVLLEQSKHYLLCF